jgi:hypothetical protein
MFQGLVYHDLALYSAVMAVLIGDFHRTTWIKIKVGKMYRNVRRSGILKDVLFVKFISWCLYRFDLAVVLIRRDPNRDMLSNLIRPFAIVSLTTGKCLATAAPLIVAIAVTVRIAAILALNVAEQQRS